MLPATGTCVRIPKKARAKTKTTPRARPNRFLRERDLIRSFLGDPLTLTAGLGMSPSRVPVLHLVQRIERSILVVLAVIFVYDNFFMYEILFVVQSSSLLA